MFLYVAMISFGINNKRAAYVDVLLRNKGAPEKMLTTGVGLNYLYHIAVTLISGFSLVD